MSALTHSPECLHDKGKRAMSLGSTGGQLPYSAIAFLFLQWFWQSVWIYLAREAVTLCCKIWISNSDQEAEMVGRERRGQCQAELTSCFLSPCCSWVLLDRLAFLDKWTWVFSMAEGVSVPLNQVVIPFGNTFILNLLPSLPAYMWRHANMHW